MMKYFASHNKNDNQNIRLSTFSPVFYKITALIFIKSLSLETDTKLAAEF